MANNDRKLALRLSKLEREVRSLGSISQLGNSSIDDGSLDVNDPDGNPVVIISPNNGVITVGGPTPATPTAPVVEPGGSLRLNVAYDGTYIEMVAGEGPALSPRDFSRTTIHLLDPTMPMDEFDPVRTHLPVGYFAGVQGGKTTILAPAETEVKIVLVTWSIAGKLSEPSEGVLATADGSGVAFDSPEWVQLLIDADAAQQAAEEAADAANAAQVDATQALLDAAAADQQADTAVANAQTAQTAATNAALAAAAAQQTANTGVTNAQTAQTAATNAGLAAAAAQQRADLGVTNAQTANTAATNAGLAAGAAQTDADLAQAHADGIDPITGGVLQTSATAARGVKITSGGLTAYDAAGAATVSILSSTGAATFKGAITSGSTVTGSDVVGGTVTGALVQTTATAARGIKINTTGFTAYDGAGAPTVTIDSATGAATFKGAINSGSTVTGTAVVGGSVTGALVETVATAARGIKISSGGLTAYDGAGAPTVTIDSATGAATFKGAINSGSTITGTAVTGGSVTGTIVQTEATAARGVKLTTAGFYAYNSSGEATVFINAATGAATFKGAINSGSTITGTDITGGRVTGAILETESTTARGIKISSAGLIGYDSLGVPTTSINPLNGKLTMTGPILTGGSISGALIETDPSSTTKGIKIDTNGIRAYRASDGGLTFSVDGNSGLVTIGGATVAGSFKTSTSNSRRVEIDDTTGGGIIRFYHPSTSVSPGSVASSTSATTWLSMTSGTSSGQPYAGKVSVSPGTDSNGGLVLLEGNSIFTTEPIQQGRLSGGVYSNPGWQPVTPQVNLSAASGQAPQAYIDGAGTVHVRGAVTINGGSSAFQDIPIATLPFGYAPIDRTQYAVVRTNAAGQMANLTIDTSGNITARYSGTAPTAFGLEMTWPRGSF